MPKIKTEAVFSPKSIWAWEEKVLYYWSDKKKFKIKVVENAFVSTIYSSVFLRPIRGKTVF